MSRELIYLEKFSGRVDEENHIIHGVSLMTIGPADGHDMEVDQTTLQQVKRLIPPNGLKAKVNHRDAGGVMSLNGRVKNPRIEGDKLKGDWHLNPGRSNTSDILALAEFQPEDAGFSLTCFTTKERKGERTFMRVSGLKSADLVDEPATNASMFSRARVDKEEDDIMELSELQAAHEKLQKAHDELLGKFTELSKKVDNHQTFLTDELPDIIEEAAGASEGRDGTELSAAFGRASRKRGRATELSADAIAAAVEKVTKPLTDRITALETQNKATETLLKALPQQPVRPNENGSGNNGPTKEETELKTRLTAARTELEAAKGTDKTVLAIKFNREFGPDWKAKLTQLEKK